METRRKLAQAFGIAKTGSTHISDNRVISDGYDIGAIERAITVPALQAYLNTTETDHDILWTILIDKTEGRSVQTTSEVHTAPVIETMTSPIETLEGSIFSPKKRGRPARAK